LNVKRQLYIDVCSAHNLHRVRSDVDFGKDSCSSKCNIIQLQHYDPVLATLV